jgi:4,4'-diaponeurosporenoate glycosyltransferase
VTLALVTGGLLAATWLGTRLRPLRGGDLQPARGVSVVVPARNEAETLPRLLASLNALDPAPAEVIVVDDDSTDDTAGVARAHGARVIRTSPPPGWLGKPWACQLGARAAGGTHLLFLDADTWLASGAVGALLAEHERCTGLLSVQPHHVTRRPYEQLSAYGNTVAVLASRTLAFGPCLLTSVDDYERVGGHAAVAVEIVEDVALAARYRAADLPVTCFSGGDLVQFRMYPGGLRQLLDGWSKNLAAGAARADPLAVAGTTLWIASHAAVTTALVRGLIGRRRGRRVAVGPLAAWAAVAVHQRWLLRRLGSFRWWTATAFPVPLFAFMAIFDRSTVLLVTGGEVSWRGRRVRPCR